MLFGLLIFRVSASLSACESVERRLDNDERSNLGISFILRLDDRRKKQASEICNKEQVKFAPSFLQLAERAESVSDSVLPNLLSVGSIWLSSKQQSNERINLQSPHFFPPRFIISSPSLMQTANIYHSERLSAPFNEY